MSEAIEICASESELEEFPESPPIINEKEDDEVNLKVYVAKTHKNAHTPRKGSKYAAAYDVYTCEDGIIPARDTKRVNTGIQLEIQTKNVCAKIYSRSGLKYGRKVGVISSPSIIDRDFIDTIYIPMYNDSTEDFHYAPGMRIAQMTFEKYLNTEWLYVKCKEDFPIFGKDAEIRGSFGSTGDTNIRGETGE